MPPEYFLSNEATWVRYLAYDISRLKTQGTAKSDKLISFTSNFIHKF